MSSGSPTPTKTSSKSQKSAKMTRAVVTNLNRQKSAKECSSNGGIPQKDSNTPTSSPNATPSKPRKPSPHKSLPPQPPKELPDAPEIYIVRPAPSTSGAKVERNDRRVFINRGTMER